MINSSCADSRRRALPAPPNPERAAGDTRALEHLSGALGPQVERRLPALRYQAKHAAFRREVRQALGSEAAVATELSSARRKTLILGALIASTYGLLMSGTLQGTLLLACVAISQPIYLITAMGIAHDASHSALGRRTWLNRAGTFVFDLLGINGYIWHFDHVSAHHSAPNVSRYDANLYGWGPIRLDPHSPLRSWHRHQHLYAPFIYALASLFKVFVGDFLAFARHRVEAYLPARHSRGQLGRLVAFKLWAVFFALGLPLLINGQAAYVLGGYLLGHVCAGLLMGAIFQPTHTNERVTWLRPNGDGVVPTSFEAHVLATAADFSVQSGWVTWLAGGLNIHAIHHLLPRLTHLELPRAARIIGEIAPKHGLRYQTFPTWREALVSHFRALRQLGVTAPLVERGKLRG